MRVLVLGASGLIGNALYNALNARSNFVVVGTVKSKVSFDLISSFSNKKAVRIDLTDYNNVQTLFQEHKPNLVINCAGITKHVNDGNNSIKCLQMNSVLPQILKEFCNSFSSRLIHISTDCIFNGLKGNYYEDSEPSAIDLYGRTKILGEVIDNDILTIRTSTIGHELRTRNGLLEWFLEQKECFGYSNAFFSGLTNIEFAKIICEIVIPQKMSGLYHIGGPRINKLELLKLIRASYACDISILEDNSFMIDRSLNSTKFNLFSGYSQKSWKSMIDEMHMLRDKDKTN